MKQNGLPAPVSWVTLPGPIIESTTEVVMNRRISASCRQMANTRSLSAPCRLGVPTISAVVWRPDPICPYNRGSSTLSRVAQSCVAQSWHPPRPL